MVSAPGPKPSAWKAPLALRSPLGVGSVAAHPLNHQSSRELREPGDSVAASGILRRGCAGAGFLSTASDSQHAAIGVWGRAASGAGCWRRSMRGQRRPCSGSPRPSSVVPLPRRGARPSRASCARWLALSISSAAPTLGTADGAQSSDLQNQGRFDR